MIRHQTNESRVSSNPNSTRVQVVVLVPSLTKRFETFASVKEAGEITYPFLFILHSLHRWEG